MSQAEALRDEYDTEKRGHRGRIASEGSEEEYSNVNTKSEDRTSGETESPTAQRSRTLSAAKISEYELELYWLLLGKTTFHTCGIILSTILEHTIPLSSDIWYWDEVLGSSQWMGFYSLQTTPSRLVAWGSEILKDVQMRRGRGLTAELQRGKESADQGWKTFYGLVKDAIRERSVADVRRRVLSPVTVVREEVRGKRAALQRLKMMGANALGLLLGEGLGQERFVDIPLPTYSCSIKVRLLR